jgi:YgiT-type zinc finger domain-containing protein
MLCELCGRNGAQVHRVTRTYGKGKNILVIENVPVVSCPLCGESYLEAETLHELERIKLHRKSFASKRLVPVAHYS